MPADYRLYCFRLSNLSAVEGRSTKEAPEVPLSEEEVDGRMEHVWRFGFAPVDVPQPHPRREVVVSPAETLNRMESWAVSVQLM